MAKRTIWSISTSSKVKVRLGGGVAFVVVVEVVLTPLSQLTSPKLKIHFQSRFGTYFEQISFFAVVEKKSNLILVRFKTSFSL